MNDYNVCCCSIFKIKKYAFGSVRWQMPLVAPPVVLQFRSPPFTLRRRVQTSNMQRCNLLPAYLPFTSRSRQSIYNAPYCRMFIKFHFTFIQQHFCETLFVVIWDILRMDCIVTSTFVRGRRRCLFVLPALWLALRVLCHNSEVPTHSLGCFLSRYFIPNWILCWHCHRSKHPAFLCTTIFNKHSF